MKNSDSHLVIYLPGLLQHDWLLHNNDPSLKLAPTLCRLLSRARILCDGPGSQLADRSQVWRFEQEQHDIPFAHVRSHLHSSNDTTRAVSCIMCADPVYIQADRDEAILLAHEELELDENEVMQLLDSLNQHFAEDGLHFSAASDVYWYVYHDSVALSTVPVADVLTKPVRAALPSGNDAAQWWRWLNEIQMILHAHPVNELREQQGLLPVNSLWFWGNSQPAAINPDRKWSAIFSSSLIDQAFADLQACNTDVTQLLNSLQQGNVLWIDDSLLEAIRDYVIDEWNSALQHMEIQIIRPALLALQSGHCQHIEILPGNGQRYELELAHTKKWWKRSRSLLQLAQSAT